jgi:membrane-bound inhibitor of C-type lysozyme
MTFERLAAGFRFALYCIHKGAEMSGYRMMAAIAAVAALYASGTAAFAQATTFRTYHCADGSEFIVGFYPYDSSAYLQIDGGSVMLRKRVAISGARYASRGTTLRIAKSGRTTVKRSGRTETACEVKNLPQ